MKFKTEFPLPRGGRNFKAISEAVLLNPGYEAALAAAANRAKTADQEVFVSRSYGPAARFSVWIVDQGSGDRLARRKALAAALGRVKV